MKTLICIYLLISSYCYSQNPGFVLLKEINGVKVYYKNTKTKETTSKDTWVIEFEFTNTTDGDIFYKTAEKPLSAFGTTSKSEKVVIYNFATVNLENSKAFSLLSANSINLAGDKTRLLTDKNEAIYMLKKGKTYTKSADFRADKGIEPILSIQIINSITFSENLKDFL